jgi:sodium pump decarboxylase gamma subunit
MMANFQIGLQLTVVGMSIVFLVLLLLMYMMKIMSGLIRGSDVKRPSAAVPVPVPVVETAADDEELAAVIAAVTGMMPEVQADIAQIRVGVQ